MLHQRRRMPISPSSKPTLALALALACFVTATAAFSQPAAKTMVTDETQLPRFSYKLPMSPSMFLGASDADFAPFAARVRGDIDSTLAAYDISDKATDASYYSTKVALDMLARDFPAVRIDVAALKTFQTKPELKLLAGQIFLTYVDAATASDGDTSAFDAAYTAADRTAIDALPWAIVADSIKARYGSDQTTSSNAILGFVANTLDPAYAKSGTLDGADAQLLVRLRAGLQFGVPYVGRDAAVLAAYIARNAVVKPDIWTARDVTIPPGRTTTNVNVGIWDSGVDPSDYPGRMFVDAHGHNGLSFDDDTKASTSDLFPLPANVAHDYERDVTYTVGQSDLQLGIDSPEARATAAYYKSLSTADAKTFFHELDFLDEYEHGSHVAGIATHGNAAARIVVARFDDNFSILVTDRDPAVWIAAMAANLEAQGAYFRTHRVRVVNMSWGDQVSEFETWLALVDPNSDPVARKAKAKSLYATWRDAVGSVIEKSPGTLFVAAAGNSDSDATFGGDVPASLVFPNLMTVGAVNQAGDATNFTSYGPTVAVFADGYEVPSKIPGNHVVKFSGTSMASPNVTNLAAKLFALDPKLTPVQVRSLIVRGATISDDGKRKLIDPIESVKLLKGTAAKT